MTADLHLNHLELAYDYVSDPIALVDNGQNLIYVNASFENTFGVDKKELIQRPVKDLLLFLGNSSENNWADIFKSLVNQTKSNWKGVADLISENGSMHKTKVSVSCLGNEQQILCCLLQFDAFIAIDLQEENLAQLAYRDSLTGLANRSLFNQLFDHEISHAERAKIRFAVLFIDLDKFKSVNDNMGHDAGDIVLCTIAQRLEQSLRKSDVIARLGGDEFAVLMNNIKDSDTVARVTEKLIREIKKPIKSGSQVMEVGCSIGISVYPDNGLDAEQLIQHADVAMYRAKHQGGNNYYYFSDALNRELQDIRLVEKQIVQALKEEQFVPHFQPVINQSSGNVVAIECLARWKHPQRGILAAMEFIPVALKIGLVQDVLNQVLKQAFSSLGVWHNQHNLNIPMSINITGAQFYQQNTFDLMAELLDKHQLTTNSIRLEVTESTLQDSGNDLVEQLKKISLAGFSITLDDFGTGYSSLRFLQQLPVDTLKIDRSFVRNLDSNPHDKVIVKAIIQLAETLGIQAVAEGVENEQQRQFLTNNDCNIMQGYLFSPALSEADLTAYLSEHS